MMKIISTKTKQLLRLIRWEAADCAKMMCSLKYSWIYIPLLCSIFLVYYANYYEYDVFLTKGFQESAAIWLLGSTIFILILSCIRNRDALSLFLLVFAINFMIRELDSTVFTVPCLGEFTIRSKGYIYFALVCMFFWGVCWYKKFFFTLHLTLDDKFFIKASILRTFLIYLLSQAIARRLFKYIPILPYEARLHVPLEEVTENFAHFCFLITAFTLLWINPKIFGSQDQVKKKTNVFDFYE